MERGARRRGRAPSGPARHWSALVDPILTVRESEVVSWLAAGRTDRQIASALGLSPRTIQKHLEHVYRKLGVTTRTAAVMRVVGLLDDA
jgi:DNA-binding CsgD family transcriptional regulator